MTPPVPLPALGWAALGVLAFSGTYPATTFAERGFDPAAVGAGRSVIGAILAALALLATRAPLPSREQLRPLAAVAAGCGVGFGVLSALALSHTTSTHAAVVTGLLPMATAIAAVLLGGERPRALFWAAALAGTAAVVAYALSRGAGRLRSGDLLLLAALVAAAVGYAQGGRLARSMPGWRVCAWGLVAALPVSLPVTVIALRAHPPHPGVDSLAGLAYVSAISVFLGFFAWYRGLARAGVARASQVQLAQAPLTIAWSALLLGEALDPSALVTAVVVVVCVAVSRRSGGTVPARPGAVAVAGGAVPARPGAVGVAGGAVPARAGAVAARRGAGPAYATTAPRGATPPAAEGPAPPAAGARWAPMAGGAPLPPPGGTERTRVNRHAGRARTTHEALYEVLDAGLVAHVAFVADGESVVLPMAYARRGDELLLHGSRRNRMLTALAGGAPLCAAVTVIDGLVLGATAFSHSMNYRSAVVYGSAREIREDDAKARALDCLVEFLHPGRSALLPEHTRAELDATLVLAVGLEETSVKFREGPPRAGAGRGDGGAPWTGVVPVAVVRGVAQPG